MDEHHNTGYNAYRIQSFRGSSVNYRPEEFLHNIHYQMLSQHGIQPHIFEIPTFVVRAPDINNVAVNAPMVDYDVNLREDVEKGLMTPQILGVLTIPQRDLYNTMVLQVNKLAVWNSKREGLIGTHLLDVAKQWYNDLPVDTRRNYAEFKTAFLKEFNTDKLIHQAQEQALKIKRNKGDSIKQFAMRCKHIVNLGWAEYDDDNEIMNREVRDMKLWEVFKIGLSPKIIKTTAIEWRMLDPRRDFDDLVNALDTKDISIQEEDPDYVTEIKSIHNSSLDVNQSSEGEVRNSLSTVVDEISDRFNQMAFQIDKNNKRKTNKLKFCTHCKRSGHSKGSCWQNKNKNDEDSDDDSDDQKTPVKDYKEQSRSRNDQKYSYNQGKNDQKDRNQRENNTQQCYECQERTRSKSRENYSDYNRGRYNPSDKFRSNPQYNSTSNYRGYSQDRRYSQNRGYSQDRRYPQNRGYSQENRYPQNRGYSQERRFQQNRNDQRDGNNYSNYRTYDRNRENIEQNSQYSRKPYEKDKIVYDEEKSQIPENNIYDQMKRLKIGAGNINSNNIYSAEQEEIDYLN